MFELDNDLKDIVNSISRIKDKYPSLNMSHNFSYGLYDKKNGSRISALTYSNVEFSSLFASQYNHFLATVKDINTINSTFYFNRGEWVSVRVDEPNFGLLKGRRFQISSVVTNDQGHILLSFEHHPASQFFPASLFIPVNVEKLN